jgi:hypothetical protein
LQKAHREEQIQVLQRKANRNSDAPCSPAAHRRSASIGGSLCKKMLDLLSPFANIALKRIVNAAEKGYFAIICHILPENGNTWFYLRRKTILSTENNVRPNRDDRDHFLIIPIDVDQMDVH